MFPPVTPSPRGSRAMASLLGALLLAVTAQASVNEPPLHRSVLSLAPSDLQLQTLPRFEPRWVLPESIASQLAPLLAQARFEPGLAAELVARFSAPAVNGVRVAIPDRALLGRFSATERESWHTLLAFHHDNLTTRWPVSLGPAGLAALEVEPRWREPLARLRSTARPHGDRLVFTDLFALEDAFATPEDRRDFFRLVFESEALLLKLRRTTGQPLDAAAQAAWWQVHGRHRAIEPLLNAVAAIPDAPRLDVAHLLPRLPRALLNTFPPDLAAAEDPGVESSLLASAFFALTPGVDPRDRDGLRGWLDRECVPVEGAPHYGDIFVYGNLERTPWPYAAVYIAGDIALARRPTLFGPWQFLHLADIGRLNPRFAGVEPRVFRAKSATQQPGEPPFIPGRMPAAWRKQLQLKPLPPGPWGRLWYYDVLLAPSGSTLELLPAPDPAPVWTFTDLTRDQLLAAVTAIPMDDKVRRDLHHLFAAAQPAADGRVTVRPSLELVLATPREFRTAVFPHLVGGLSVADYTQHIPFPAGFTIDEWFDAGSLPESVRQAILRLVYPVGDRVMLSDFGALYGLLDSRREQLSAHRAALREPAVVVLLEKPRLAEVAALADYWRPTGRAKNFRRLLESFAAAGDDLRYLDIMHLLSPIERELLNSYHVPTGPDPTPSCFWTAFNFGAAEPDPRFLVPPGFTGGDEALAGRELSERYQPIAAPGRLGDILCYRRKDTGAVIHVCVFLAEGLALTKNGYNFSKPWCLSLLSDIDALYLAEPGVERVAFRRRDPP
jgi:hypothetical protein